MVEALIIGAGPAGLTAAYELLKLGIRPHLLEADDQVGGISRTVNYRDYRFDIGGHRFFSKVSLINRIWHEILGRDFLVRPRLSRIHYAGRFFDYPLRPLNAVAGLGPVEAALVCLSYAKSRFRPSPHETSFEEWVSNRFGYRLYEIFFKTYTEKVWGIPCSEISVDWAAQRIKNLSLSEALRNAIFRQTHAKDGEVLTTLIEQFHYPRLGPGMMWDRCADIVHARGGETTQGARVVKLRHRHGRVESAVAREPDGQLREIPADHFISTMPVRDLVNALDPAPPAEVLRAANSLRYRDYLTVVLIVDREKVFPDNWIYIHSPDVRMGRVQNYKNWSPEMVPDQRRTSLGLEYFLWDEDEEWRWPEGRLIERGIEDCRRIDLIDPAEVEDGTVVRMPKAYPIYDQTYRANVDRVRAYLAQLSNLQLIGRNGQHRYNNQDHSMLTGIFAARNIAGADYDVWSVNTEQEYHEGEQPTAEERLTPVPRKPESEEERTEKILQTVFARVDPIALGAALGTVAGIGLFAMTAILVLEEGSGVRSRLGLLDNFLPGYRISWAGAFVGLLEAGGLGFAIGAVVATLRNGCLRAYAALLRRRALAEQRRRLLDRV